MKIFKMFGSICIKDEINKWNRMDDILKKHIRNDFIYFENGSDDLPVVYHRNDIKFLKEYCIDGKTLTSITFKDNYEHAIVDVTLDYFLFNLNNKRTCECK